LPEIKASLRRLGIVLSTPFCSAKHATPHSWNVVLGRVRYRIDTVIGEMVDRCGVKRVWAVIAGICANASSKGAYTYHRRPFQHPRG